MDEAHAVHQHNVAGAVVQQQLGGGDAAGPGPGEHKFGIFDAPPGDFQRVDDRRQYGDGGAVLVVVEYGDAQILQGVFNFEAAGGGDVFQVDAAETGGDAADGLDDGGVILGGEANGVGVHIGQGFEQDGLALHHRHGGFRPHIAQPQHRRAVADHGDGVAAVGELEGFGGVGGDGQADRGHAGGVGDGQIVQRFHPHFGGDAELAAGLPVPPDGLCPVISSHNQTPLPMVNEPAAVGRTPTLIDLTAPPPAGVGRRPKPPPAKFPGVIIKAMPPSVSRVNQQIQDESAPGGGGNGVERPYARLAIINVPHHPGRLKGSGRIVVGIMPQSLHPHKQIRKAPDGLRSLGERRLVPAAVAGFGVIQRAVNAQPFFVVAFVFHPSEQQIGAVFRQAMEQRVVSRAHRPAQPGFLRGSAAGHFGQ